MKTPLLSQSMLEVAKVFASNGALCFRRLSDTSFIVPLYKTEACFTINVNDAHSVTLTPITLTFKAAKPLLSVRDLLKSDTVLEKAFFRCYYDPSFVLDNDRFTTAIGLSYHGKRYDLNCKVYIPKYEKFYETLVPNASRKHVTVRVENVQLPAVQKYKSP